MSGAHAAGWRTGDTTLERLTARSPEALHAVDFKPLESVGVLDDLIFQATDIYRLHRAELEQLQLSLIGEAFSLHYERNEDYRRYCERLGARPRRFNAVEDLASIPLVTSTQFKLRDVLSCDRAKVVKTCVSSGTQGSISRVYRDETTMCRFLGSVQSSVDEILSLDDAYCLHLGPAKDEAGELWFSYVMSTTDLIFPTENFVHGGRFDPAAVVRRFQEVRAEYENVLLVGAPVMFLNLVEYMTAHQLREEECGHVLMVTGGGWKRFEGGAIPRPEFESLLARRFCGLSQANFRDFFNMVELNAVFPECERRIKHVPPWIRLCVLDPRTLRPVPTGEVGLLAYLDPTPTSFPGFVLADDFARLVFDEKCACGRHGQGVEIIRRVSKVESRGCALKIDRTYAGPRSAQG